MGAVLKLTGLFQCLAEAKGMRGDEGPGVEDAFQVLLFAHYAMSLSCPALNMFPVLSQEHRIDQGLYRNKFLHTGALLGHVPHFLLLMLTSSGSFLFWSLLRQTEQQASPL